MYYRLLILLVFICAVNPPRAFANKVETLFHKPYHRLLEKVADASPLFADPASVEQTIKSQDGKDRVSRLRKRIAVTRMLLADGQLQSGEKVSCLFAKMTASQLIKAGENWVLMAQAQTDKGKEGGTETKEVEEETAKPQEKALTTEKKKRDNRFDIFDDDEFNLFDVLAFPFRLIGMILELLFNIVLFPFKIITKLLF